MLARGGRGLGVVFVWSLGIFWLLGGFESAHAGCRAIAVEGARMATVRIFGTDGSELETVRGEALAGLTSAQECTEDTRYLLIQYNGRGVLVQRGSMVVANTYGERPLCPCPGAIASAGDRLAADSGAGDGICQVNPNCTGNRR